MTTDTAAGYTAGHDDEWRVEFDADVTFSNGGALQAQEFRLDIPGTTIDDDDLADLFVAHLGLLMAGKVVISRKTLLREPHKGSRGVMTSGSARSVLDLTGETTAATVAPRTALGGSTDLEVVLVRLAGSTAAAVDRSALASFDVRGRAVLLHTGAPRGAGVTAAAGDWLAGHGAAAVGTDQETLGPGAAALVAAGVTTVTCLHRLDHVPVADARLHVVPGPGGSGPVRAYVVTGSG